VIFWTEQDATNARELVAELDRASQRLAVALQGLHDCDSSGQACPSRWGEYRWKAIDAAAEANQVALDLRGVVVGIPARPSS
jgi:hypothetical protein